MKRLKHAMELGFLLNLVESPKAYGSHSLSFTLPQAARISTE